MPSHSLSSRGFEPRLDRVVDPRRREESGWSGRPGGSTLSTFTKEPHCETCTSEASCAFASVQHLVSEVAACWEFRTLHAKTAPFVLMYILVQMTRGLCNWRLTTASRSSVVTPVPCAVTFERTFYLTI
ncbi:hypothetical protein TGVAND_364120 [Toxoplasma gondii VAND]|uniref:Cytochrome b/b6 N-terminal region profile domain-containing protein n=1 Tax=Toxoplasma gondii VAND TaxID=933077 RepID=A0A086PK52_TOXGO|nr:hypothetical protein TGVAND_364120 [Toxoplasma gondii VAND]